MPGILVGVDGSDHSHRALNWAMRHAAQQHAPLTVLAVRPDPVRPATVIYWGEAHPGVSWQVALTCAGISTFAAALVESLPMPWNDNFRVGTTAALVGSFVQIVCLGR